MRPYSNVLLLWNLYNHDALYFQYVRSVFHPLDVQDWVQASYDGQQSCAVQGSSILLWRRSEESWKFRPVWKFFILPVRTALKLYYWEMLFLRQPCVTLGKESDCSSTDQGVFQPELVWTLDYWPLLQMRGEKDVCFCYNILLWRFRRGWAGEHSMSGQLQVVCFAAARWKLPDECHSKNKGRVSDHSSECWKLRDERRGSVKDCAFSIQAVTVHQWPALFRNANQRLV